MSKEFKGTKQEKADQYAEGKSSSSVFRDAHVKDYLAGYDQAIKDSHVPELLELSDETVIQLESCINVLHTLNMTPTITGVLLELRRMHLNLIRKCTEV